MVSVLSLRPIWRASCSGRAAGESAGSVRRMPSAVISYAHASAIAMGNPITTSSTISRTAQLGMLKNGKTWVAIWISSQLATE